MDVVPGTKYRRSRPHGGLADGGAAPRRFRDSDTAFWRRMRRR